MKTVHDCSRDQHADMPKRILFVDDEPMVLHGLQRSLRPLRNNWEMVFAAGGAEALEAMGRQSFDIVVTDMRMPGMDGAQLLEEVKKRSPQSLRMVLSGQSDQETILRSVNPAHQYVSKPCEGEELKSRLVRAFAAKDLLQSLQLRELVSRLESLPSLPTFYVQLTAELHRPEPNLQKVEQLIGADMAMTAKVLQLVNSAFFGLRCHVSRAAHAVELLGLDTIRALALSAHVFTRFNSSLLTSEDTRHLSEHSLATSNYARRIALLEHAEPRVVDDAFTAGLLHDAGKLMLAATLGEKYQEVLEVAKADGCGLEEAERQKLGCGHAQVAAYLFGLWGLPDGIVEAVAWHHHPAETSTTKFSPVAAVHAASIYHDEKASSRMRDRTAIDGDFLTRIGCGQREKVWRRDIQGEDVTAKP